MNITRRHILASITAAAVLGASAMAQAADTVRIGLPTKTYWPTTIAETAVRQKLFEKEGITAELTIYRGGAETFEAMAAAPPTSSSTPPRWYRPDARRASTPRCSPMPPWAITAGS